MRLTCPNCGAQYEVPDEVIPEAGRDVQCSNCGNTWFQTHPNNPEATPEQEPVIADPQDDWAEEPEDDDLPPAETKSQPERRELDEGITSVLREEAEREQRARQGEQPDGLESQPDLGLSMDEEADKRSRQAKARMARLRGLDPEAESSPVLDTDPDIAMGSRRNLLPDIEDVDERIEAEAEHGRDDSLMAESRGEDTPTKRQGGFGRGFRWSILLAALATAIYIFAPQLIESVPAITEPLQSYVATVDQVRTVLSDQFGGLAEQIRSAIGM